MSWCIRILFSIGRSLLIAGGTGGLFSTPCLADGEGNSLDVTIKAHIVENTCQISLADGGTVHLPTVSRHWFYNDDGSTRLQPGDAASGTLFSINVDSCAGDATTVNTMTFGFQPQNGIWPAQSQQVFINETPAVSGGAENVGVVIFSTSDNRNVVNSNGTSAVAIDVSKTASYLTSYDFYARYQSLGVVSAGKVTSHVLVDAIYN